VTHTLLSVLTDLVSQTRAEFEDALINYLQRRDFEDAIIDYLERRGGHHSKATAEEEERERQEKERKKAFREGHKEYKKIGKEIHKEAKAEGRVGVNAVYSGPGEHRDRALKAAQKGWRKNNNLQQFTHADVTYVFLFSLVLHSLSEHVLILIFFLFYVRSAKKLENGRTHVSVRYHKNDGAVGVYDNHLLD